MRRYCAVDVWSRWTFERQILSFEPHDEPISEGKFSYWHRCQVKKDLLFRFVFSEGIDDKICRWVGRVDDGSSIYCRFQLISSNQFF